MHTYKRIQYIKDILARISNQEEVSLKERLFIKRSADEDQNISAWFNKARRLQQDEKRLANNPIDQFNSELYLGSVEPHSNNISTPEDLGISFSGAPSWVARS